MPKDLFAAYPRLASDALILRKMELADAEDMFQIYGNPEQYRYTPGSPRKTLKAVQNMVGHFERDFKKRKTLFLGICRLSNPGRIIGMAEMFDYAPKVNMVTIGYRLHEDFRGRGIATKAVKLMTDYLLDEIGLNRIQAFVMPANQKSPPVLLRNGFQKEGVIRQGYVWTGKGTVDLAVYSLLGTDPRL